MELLLNKKFEKKIYEFYKDYIIIREKNNTIKIENDEIGSFQYRIKFTFVDFLLLLLLVSMPPVDMTLFPCVGRIETIDRKVYYLRLSKKEYKILKDNSSFNIEPRKKID